VVRRHLSDATLEFDGVEYPDGPASDPLTLGWMQGAPPNIAARIRFEDDRFLEFPQIRWTLSHLRELMPTASVWRGPGASSDLGAPSDSLEEAIDALQFDDLQGRRLNWRESLNRTYADGILVLHRGRIAYERYFGVLQPRRPHLCFSITKSYVGTLAATLVYEGALDAERLIPHYLPEMSGTAFEHASVRQVLDMLVNIAGSEDYRDPRALFWQYCRAGGFRPRLRDDEGPGHYYEFLQSLRADGEHGHAFTYKTVNTELLCWVMKRVTGIGLAEMLGERLWSRIGCEEDGYLAVDSIGVPMGGAGLCATLRDLARFGELMRCDGGWRGQQVIPAAVVADICRGADRHRFALAGYDLLKGYSYRSMWWVAHDALEVFEGRGIHGQRLYIAPRAECVIARFASHPIAASSANDPVTLPSFRALCRLLSER
jgi:CubicO group peptidase (beta-lactamase class C family)